MFAQIIRGIVCIGTGWSILYFSGNLVEMFGSIARAEKNLGSTRAWYLLFGFGVMVIGFLLMFGIIKTQSPV